MLAIAPMPVDGIRDSDALEKLNSRSIKIPAIPLGPMAAVEIPRWVSEAVASAASSVPVSETENHENLAFAVQTSEPGDSAALPPRRSITDRQIGVASKSVRSSSGSVSPYRPAAPVSKKVKQVAEQYQKTELNRSYLLMLAVIFAFLFIAVTIFLVKHYELERKAQNSTKQQMSQENRAAGPSHPNADERTNNNVVSEETVKW